MPYRFACADAGCTCKASWSESSPDAVVAKVAAHLQEKHNVRTISGTLANYVTVGIRKT
jgi:predicted small metal-binding protein